jgi:hypothetical protein
MTKFKIGDRVRIKDCTHWASPAGCKLAFLEGQVIDRIERDSFEEPEDFKEFIDVKLDKDDTIIMLREEALEKIE